MEDLVETILQIIGATFYTLNKIALWRYEQSNHAKWHHVAWWFALLGLPAWAILLGYNRNWIAALLELSCLPAIILGLMLTTAKPPWLEYAAIAAVALGLGLSLYDFGGITELHQWLEIGLSTGFLIGTYHLVHEKRSGYLWYVLMHVSCGWLMWIQDYYWLAVQQSISLVFICAAYSSAKRRKKQGEVT